MVLTQEENDLLTRIGPGTPAGELLRRYWYPIAVSQDISEERPTKFVRILGEDLVLWKDKSGHVGLIQDHCPHRSASLLYGRVEERGIACAYHGWLYDTDGNCLETPAEPAGSLFHLTVKARAYPVRQYIGLYWAYLGPQPAPEIPHFDLWVRKDGRRRIYVQPLLDCNWLAPMENSADFSHSHILHGVGALRPGGPKPGMNTTRGTIDEVAYFEVYETEIGLWKKRVLKTGDVDDHPIVFPNILRHANDTQIRVPIDDTHTQVYFVNFVPSKNGEVIEEDESELEVTYLGPYKIPVQELHPFTRFTMHSTQPEDHMVWETQGPIANRTVERLATSDRGVVLLREMIRREIDKVQEGGDPMNVYRDPEHSMIDTKHSLQVHGWGPNAGRRADAPRDLGREGRTVGRSG
jgi:5,5'-dehydrodivanillate O-demethylase